MAPISEETVFIIFSITRNSLGLYEEIEKGQLHQITGGDNKKKYFIASYMSFNFLRRSQRLAQN